MRGLRPLRRVDLSRFLRRNAAYPSSDPAARGHLLPQGEKGDGRLVICDSPAPLGEVDHGEAVSTEGFAESEGPHPSRRVATIHPPHKGEGDAVFHVKRLWNQPVSAKSKGPASPRAPVSYPKATNAQVFIDWKKSSLFFDCRSLSSRNSIASWAPIGVMMRRRMNDFCRCSFGVMRSSLRVPDLMTSTAG